MALYDGPPIEERTDQEALDVTTLLRVRRELGFLAIDKQYALMFPDSSDDAAAAAQAMIDEELSDYLSRIYREESAVREQNAHNTAVVNTLREFNDLLGRLLEEAQQQQV